MGDPFDSMPGPSMGDPFEVIANRPLCTCGQPAMWFLAVPDGIQYLCPREAALTGFDAKIHSL